MKDWKIKEVSEEMRNMRLFPFSAKHPKCLLEQCNHPLDPIEYDCGYNTTLICDKCKYGMGRKDPEAKCNQIEE